MYYDDELVEEVRLKNDIVDVISGYVKLQKRGSTYFGLCPFHNEKSPSFSVTPSKQMFYCFGCGAGGNVFTFMMKYENDSFPEAVQRLAERVGVALPEGEMSSEQKRQSDIKKILLEINKKAATYYFKRLRMEDAGHAYRYLRERELSEETIKSFGLGYAGVHNNELYQYLKREGYSDDILKETGLISYDERRGAYDKFWNRVMFPIMDVNRRVIGFGGRVMGDGKPKYLNSPETKIFDKSRNLYGLHAAKSARSPYLILCEGYMDVIAMHQAGFQNAAASLGTAFTTGQASLIKRYFNKVILAYDSDGAGVKAALRAIPICRQAGLTARVLSLSPYKDPDEFIKNSGREAFEERLENAENSFFFELRILERDYDLNDPDSRTLFYREMAVKLLQFEDPLERSNYIEKVAEKYRISVQNLTEQVNRAGLQADSRQRQEEFKTERTNLKSKENGIRKAQKLLLTWLIEKPELYEKIKGFIVPEDFTEELYYKAAQVLFAQFEEGQMNPARIIGMFATEEEQSEAASLFNASLAVETEEEQKRALYDTVRRVKENGITHAIEQIDIMDIAGLQKLTNVKQNLDSEMQKLHIL